MQKAIGILLTNTGSPNSPGLADVRAYLKAFLSDPRVVRLPGILWKPLLNAIILPKRAPYSAELYRKIWTSQGSPLRSMTEALANDLEKYLCTQSKQNVTVEVGMHYGQPSIPDALAKLRAKNIDQLIILPLFPQYSTTTTEATRDQTQAALKDIDNLDHAFITHYAEHPEYIDALVAQIKMHHPPENHLVFSFHGLPQVFANQGDPYPLQCEQTAKLVAQALQLEADQWTLAYQSRFGYAKWLAPYTFQTLQSLPQRGIRKVSIVCPGFSVDCLETLEEIQIRGKEEFHKSGGESFCYIPALNNSQAHVRALGAVIKEINC